LPFVLQQHGWNMLLDIKIFAEKISDP
jgi:hypothetical protein